MSFTNNPVGKIFTYKGPRTIHFSNGHTVKCCWYVKGSTYIAVQRDPKAPVITDRSQRIVVDINDLELLPNTGAAKLMDFRSNENVKIIRKADSQEDEWSDSWKDEMDNEVDKIGRISGIVSTKSSVSHRVETDTGNFWYPYFCLERVATETKAEESEPEEEPQCINCKKYSLMNFVCTKGEAGPSKECFVSVKKT